MATPVWQAGQAGLIGNAAAVAASAQVNQLLGTHGNALLYEGNRFLLQKYIYQPTGNNPWNTPLATHDVDMPFVMSGTVIGRIQLPILAVGSGADLLVSLCSDNGSGAPGTMITQTRIPASWINAQSVVSGLSGPASTFPTFDYTNSPLAASQFTTWSFANQTVLPYNFPAISFTGISANPSTAYYGNYVIIIGGVSNDVALTGTFTMTYDNAGNLSPAVPQPAFPNGNDGSSMTCVVVDAVSGTPVVANTGGGTSFGGAATSNVFTSSLDTTAGTLSSWAAQTALPAAVQSHSMASWNGYVYSLGGKNSTGNLATVNYAQVQNGQITTWTATTPLPVASGLSYCIAVNGYMVVAGGTNAAFSPSYATTYYAVINGNGSLGPWLNGPPLTTGIFNLNSNTFSNTYGALIPGYASGLNFTTTGPSWTWAQDQAGGGAFLNGFVDQGNGAVLEYSLAPSENVYAYATFNLTPYISVPLPATGLTSGTTYHILMQQAGGNAANYLVTIIGANAYGNTSGVPTVQLSPPGAYTWTAQQQYSGVGISMYDQTVIGNTPVHTWEDSGARISTFIYATTPDQRLIGLCEATTQNLATNQNQGFESGLTPWTVSGGTYAQSTTQVKEGIHSCQITPSGSAANVYIQSEQIATIPGQPVMVSGWVWLTTAVTSNVTLNLNWYTLAGGYLSTSSNVVSVGATSWTQLTNTFTAPATAYFYTIDATVAGTPASSNIIYWDQLYTTTNMTEQVSSAVEITYPGVYPDGTYPPTGLDVIE